MIGREPAAGARLTRKALLGVLGASAAAGALAACGTGGQSAPPAKAEGRLEVLS
jgi:hypothetical protein